MNRFPILQIVILGLGLWGLLGCGASSTGPGLPAGPVATVKGTLQYQGKPITQGLLQLESGNGYTVSSVVGTDGSFELQGPHGKTIPAGAYQVGVSPPRPEVKPGDLNSPVVKIEGLPEKFYSPRSSGVTVEIREGAQDLRIELK
jgi:hypothetical protein